MGDSGVLFSSPFVIPPLLFLYSVLPPALSSLLYSSTFSFLSPSALYPMHISPLLSPSFPICAVPSPSLLARISIPFLPLIVFLRVMSSSKLVNGLNKNKLVAYHFSVFSGAFMWLGQEDDLCFRLSRQRLEDDCALRISCPVTSAAAESRSWASEAAAHS